MARIQQHLALENINLACAYLGSRTYERFEVFVSLQAETRNDAVKYKKSESITWVIY